MADFNALETLINAYIKKNGVQAITGNILNGVLRGMVSALGKGYTIVGVATPSTDPGTLTGPCAYYASTYGTYTNFGNIVVNDGEIAMLIYDEQTWHKEKMWRLDAEASIDANVGTPSVETSFEDELLTFRFHNIKGNPGDAAGFGTVTASVDSNIGTPGVSVQTSGPDTAKNMTFQFTNLKGETGVTSVVATVDNTIGTPTCAVSLVGQELHLDFSGLKGAQGDTGVSADYPITIVNNLTTSDPTSALSAQMGVQLESEISQLDLEVVKTDSQKLTETQKGTARTNIGIQDALYGSFRNFISNVYLVQGAINADTDYFITDYIPIQSGDSFDWVFGNVGRSVSQCYYDSTKLYLNYISSSGYTNHRTGTVGNTSIKYVRCTFYKYTTDGKLNTTPITINGTPLKVSYNNKGYTNYVKDGELGNELRWKPLPLGSLVNSDTTSSGDLQHSTTYDHIRVTTKSKILVPFPGVRLRFRFPDVPYRINCYLFLGNSAGTMTANRLSPGAMDNGWEVVLPSDCLTIRPVFRAQSTTANTSYAVPISASDIQSYIDAGTLAIEYYDESPEDVIERNGATMINLASLRRVLIKGTGAVNGMDSMPVFAHITDLHGDAPRFRNFLEYCDKVGVDFALETGDAVIYQNKDASQYIFDFANEHNTDVLACIGNHESLPTGSSTLFADNISDLATKFSYLESAGTPTTHCYYYKDYDAKKVRVIVLNQYEDGVYQTRFGQTQIDWFVATLLSTPAGYGVVIAFHSPFDKLVAESPYDVFRQPIPNTGETYQPNGQYVDKRVIELLVDAFISRGSVNFTYDDHSATYDGTNDTTTQTVSVVADFSGVDETTEFICYVCGHRHEDWIGYCDNATNRQLCLCITTGNALYGDSSNPAWSNQSDLPRGGKGVSQDCFCVYAIDRINGYVKVMRVGASVTQRMVKREMMVIPYKD